MKNYDYLYNIEYLERLIRFTKVAEKGDFLDWKQESDELHSWLAELDRSACCPEAEKCFRRLRGDDFVRLALTWLFIHKEDKEQDSTLISLMRKLFSHEASEAELYMTASRYTHIFEILFPSLGKDPVYETLKLDARLVDMISGTNEYTLTSSSLRPFKDRQELPEYLRKICDRARKAMSHEDPPILLFWGEEGAGKHSLIQSISPDEDDVLFFKIEGEKTKPNDQDLLNLLFARREAILRSAILAVDISECTDEKLKERLFSFLQDEVRPEVGNLVLLSSAEEAGQSRGGILTVEVPVPPVSYRQQLWTAALQNEESWDSIEITTLANTFALTPGKIRKAAASARLELEDGETLERGPLYRACYSQISHRLIRKAARIDTKFAWDDLILKSEAKELLRDICNSVKYRHKVMEEWNFKKVVPYGAGVSCLFAGPPGTGKTMSAQVIANELSMELYRIDLSQVIDKWVGETEKNIRSIFADAAKTSCILFFDEADSIFNKRMDATGANERFANIESSLLLQCIEDYSGISILATNDMGRIDTAFLRRFKFYLKFQEPDENERYEIWKSVIPKEAPLSPKVDLAELARVFDFTGAIIKNVIIEAAYLAAENGKSIGKREIVKAVKREMEKVGRTIDKEKLGNLRNYA